MNAKTHAEDCLNAETPFDQDPRPDALRVLFVGWAHSSHTHAWMDLFSDQDLNIRIFGMPDHLPPPDWKVKAYLPVSRFDPDFPGDSLRRVLPLDAGSPGFCHDPLQDASGHWPPAQAMEQLAQVVRSWRPQVIHTLGLNPASYFFFDARARHGLESIGKWVVQARGGPDLELNRLQPRHRARISAILGACDSFVADNLPNYQNALELGLDPARKAPFGVVPGTGGVNVQAMEPLRQGPPSSRERLIVWPKAYECPQSKALPVFEALTMVAKDLSPCRVLMLASTPEIRAWFAALPEEVQSMSELVERLPRSDVLALMGRARVMLAPSILDGIPNSLIEAMALGAFPVVSPLHTITPLVRQEENVLFARNLFPGEIASALTRAMNDDALVDAAAARNLELARKAGDRSVIGPAVVEHYKTLAWA